MLGHRLRRYPNISLDNVNLIKFKMVDSRIMDFTQQTVIDG